MISGILSLIIFLLPGFFLLRIVYPEKEKISFSLLISLSVFFSLAIIPTVFFLISLIKPIALGSFSCWGIIGGLNLGLYCFSAKKPSFKIIFPGKKRILFLLTIISLNIALLLAPYYHPHPGSFWETYHFGGSRDIEKHISLITELKKDGLPPKNPYIANQPLNYYYFYHLNAAVLSSLGGKNMPPQLAHLILSGLISTGAILLTFSFLKPLTALFLTFGYGFDFFPMLLALLKIHPYPGGLDHLDQWTIPFVKDLKVNPISVWFQWVPQHTLALFLSLILLGIFFDLIKVNKNSKTIILGWLFFVILGTSSYLFLGLGASLFIYWLYRYLKQKKSDIKNYAFILIALLPAFFLIIPMAVRIKTPTIAFYPFWQLPRDHLFSFKFPHFPGVINIFLLFLFLIERFFVYFFDLGLLFVLAVYFWKKVPKNNLTTFAKIMLIASTIISVLLKSIPFNNDLCYRVSGLSWLACAILVNFQEEALWKKFKNNLLLLLIIGIMIFSPTVVEQLVFSYQKISPEEQELENYISQNVSDNAVLQSPLEFSPATIYLFERKMVYYPTGLIFYPNKEEVEKIKNDVATLFADIPEKSREIAAKYKIEYLLTENQDFFFTESPFFKKVFGNTRYSLYRFEDISPSKQTL